MDLFANDPILKNTHFYYEMTREEKMEASYSKMPSMYTRIPEELTYQNVFHYVMLLGSLPSVLHHAMFELAVRYLGDDE
jgi:hypothetical protein